MQQHRRMTGFIMFVIAVIGIGATALMALDVPAERAPVEKQLSAENFLK